MFKMRLLITAVMLVITAVNDIKTGYVNMRVIITSSAAGLLMNIISLVSTYGWVEVPLYNLVMFAVPVFVFITLYIKNSSPFRNLIGDGDIFILLAVWINNGILVFTNTVLAAFGLSGVYAVYLYFARGRKKTYGFPFAPFIFSGFVLANV